MAWISEGAKANPVADQLLADSGQQGAGSYGVQIAASASIAALFLVQRRNAANNGTIQEFQLRVPSGDSRVHNIGNVELDTDERVRVLCGIGVIGTVQAMLFS